MKMLTRLPISHFLAALSLILSFHSCACTELYGNEINADFYSYYLDHLQSGLFYECGDPAGRCICKDHTAYCNLSSPALPVLPDDVYVLDLCTDYFRGVVYLDGETLKLPSQFFSHMKNVTELCIVNVDIMPETFLPLANVTNVYILCLWDLAEHYEKMWINVLLISNLRSFSLIKCDLNLLSLHPGLQSSLQSFSADGCSPGHWAVDHFTFDLTVLQIFKDLKRISITLCNFDLIQSAVLPALEELILDANDLRSFPQTCDMHNNSFFPSLKRMSLSKNLISHIESISVTLCSHDEVQHAALPALEELIINANKLTTFPQICDEHNNSLFPSLKRISLARNQISHIGGISITLCSHDQAQSAALPALEELILDDNTLTTFPQTCDVHNNSFFPSLKRISLARNQISQIGGSGFATCLPQVTEIDVRSNPITRIQKGVFDAQSSPNLETVNLGNDWDNPPTIHTEGFIFANPSIKTLDLTNSGWTFGPCRPVNCVAQNTFAGLSSLTHLILDENDFSDVDFDRFFALFGSLRNLTHLSVKNSNFFAKYIVDSRVCFLPLQYLDLSYTTHRVCYLTQDTFCYNSKMKIFKADRVGPFQYVPKDNVIKIDTPTCDFMYKIVLLQFPLKGSAIEHISFRDNNLDFGHVCSLSNIFSKLYCVLPESFENKTNLRVLLLDGNDFSNVDAERFVSLFGKLTNLKNFSLSNCGIKHVSAEMFHSFPRLQYLDLSNNRINTLSSHTFSALPSLNVLYLHSNVLSVVPEGLFSSDQRMRMTNFTLYENPLVCSCDNRWLQSWLLSDPDLFDYPSHSYSCFDDPTKSVANYTMPDQACMLGQEAAIAIIVTSTVTIAALTAFSLLFRYRWNFRLLLLYAMSGRPNYEGRRRNYVYDVFVSYDQEDFQWIRQQLMPELEDRMGLRVCIHQRDFIPGHYIVTNITQAVEHSKKVLMVFSRHFVLSRWCQFEVDFCLSHAIENRDSLLIVCLDDVASDETVLTGAMKAALSTMTYIQWVNRRDAIHFFWERVRLSLRDVRPRDREAGRRRQREVLDIDGRVNIEMQVMDF